MFKTEYLPTAKQDMVDIVRYISVTFEIALRPKPLQSALFLPQKAYRAFRMPIPYTYQFVRYSMNTEGCS